MSFKRLRLRWVALLMGVACLIIVLTVPFGSNRWSTGIQVLGVQSAIVPITVLLSATNRSSHDYAFSCFLEIRNKSGWSDVTPSDELRTLRYFRKGQVVQLNVGLGPKEAVYRFHCFYEPLGGTTWSSRVHERLMALGLPGALGVHYRKFLGRLQPWPRSFYSREFEVKGSAQPARSSHRPPSLALGDSLLPGLGEAWLSGGCGRARA